MLAAGGVAHAAGSRLQSIAGAFNEHACESADDDDAGDLGDARDTAPDGLACTLVSLRALLSEDSLACDDPGFSNNPVGGACAIGIAAEHRHAIAMRAPGKTARLDGVATNSRPLSTARDDSALQTSHRLIAPPAASPFAFAGITQPDLAAHHDRLDRPPRD
jgi:hypothetical protein